MGANQSKLGGADWSKLPNALIISIIKRTWQSKDIAMLPYTLMGKINLRIPLIMKSAAMSWKVNDQTTQGHTLQNDTNVGQTTLSMRHMTMLEYLRQMKK
tara:strand:- start:3817 stop:4116 length:300 start_codon:yes stop_codon:yes gene_type:complete